MSATIDVRELRVGMFVHLDLSWLAHPFPVGSFRITHAQQIDKIRSLGLRSLRWSPEKSDIAPPPLPASSPALQTQQAPQEGTLPIAAVPAAPTAEQAAAARRREQLTAQHASAEFCQRQFDEATRAWCEVQRNVLDSPSQARADAEALSRAIVDKLLVDGDVCIQLLSCHAGDKAATHAMNVAVVSLLLGRNFGMKAGEMLDLGVGAMLHDVGKLEMPERLQQADERFDKDDLAAYRQHVAYGVAQGRRMGLAPGALLVLAQHHEHADGSGFPLHLKEDKLSLASRIVALVNRYDKLCNPPLLVRALTPHEALSQLFSQSASNFDTALLNGFIRMMGVYPAGSVVQLTDDRFALVISVNSTRPLKPNVLVFDPTCPRDEALHLNLMKLPDLGIRRSLKPAQLPADALQYLAPRPRAAYFFEAVHAPSEVVAA